MYIPLKIILLRAVKKYDSDWSLRWVKLPKKHAQNLNLSLKSISYRNKILIFIDSTIKKSEK